MCESGNMFTAVLFFGPKYLPIDDSAFPQAALLLKIKLKFQNVKVFICVSTAKQNEQ